MINRKLTMDKLRLIVNKKMYCLTALIVIQVAIKGENSKLCTQSLHIFLGFQSTECWQNLQSTSSPDTYKSLGNCSALYWVVYVEFSDRPIHWPIFAFFPCIGIGRCGLRRSPIWHYLQTGVHRQLRVVRDAARSGKAVNQSSVGAFHRAVLPHLFLIIFKYSTLVLVLPHLF